MNAEWSAAAFLAALKPERGSPPAKAANPANREHPCGEAADPRASEGLRILRKQTDAFATFADLRNGKCTPQSEHRRGLSQLSQLSQGVLGVWTDVDIARFLDRRARLLRWGWSEHEAEALAERLLRRDREGDDRVSCAECQHYRPGHCGDHHSALLCSPEVGRDLVGLLQRCPGHAK